MAGVAIDEVTIDEVTCTRERRKGKRRKKGGDWLYRSAWGVPAARPGACVWTRLPFRPSHSVNCRCFRLSVYEGIEMAGGNPTLVEEMIPVNLQTQSREGVADSGEETWTHFAGVSGVNGGPCSRTGSAHVVLVCAM